MAKNFTKSFILLILLATAFINSLSAQSTVPNSELQLTKEEKQNSSLFQSLKNKDRLSVFAKLQYLIRTKESSTNESSASTHMGAKTATLTEVKALLGEPDETIQESIISYFLTSGKTTCKAVIGINKDGEVSFCTVKNCN